MYLILASKIHHSCDNFKLVIRGVPWTGQLTIAIDLAALFLAKSLCTGLEGGRVKRVMAWSILLAYVHGLLGQEKYIYELPASILATCSYS